MAEGGVIGWCMRVCRGGMMDSKGMGVIGMVIGMVREGGDGEV